MNCKFKKIKGLSLAEVMVAIVITNLIFAAAYLIYNNFQSNNMNKFEFIKQYQNLINPKYHGISLRISHLLDNYKQIGGKLKMISINDNKYKINLIKNTDDELIDLNLLSIDGTLQCGVILIHKDNPEIAIIQDIHAYDTCYESTIDLQRAKFNINIFY